MGGISTVMKLAFISDAHGNAVALDNCLSFIRSRSVDCIFHLGDAVGYLPFASEVLCLLAAHKVTCLKGNHDAMALGEIALTEERDKVYGMSSTVASLSPDEIDIMSSWADGMEWVIDGRRLLLVHGSPWNRLEGYVYPDSDKSRFAEVDADVVIMGHTHHPYVMNCFGKLLVNVGSVGLPRDVGHLSSVCILDTEDWSVQIFRIPFDVDSLRLRTESQTVHPSVWKCLERRRTDFVGEVVNSGFNWNDRND